ncbi:retrovirus-related Pol polyprotein from transposon 17.6 [Trichonephila clavipes]|nr:retrovirus-related Pol polyprotein from transposon 17.6 [Trichonephila clavipes]
MPRTRQSDPLLTQTASEKFNLIDLIPKYDGSESLGIRRFLEKISDVANLGNWSNAEKVTILKLKLAGIAEEFFYPIRLTGSSESVQEFAARINKLGTQIFQSSNATQNTAARNANDQLLQSRFISGLRNDIRRFVLARDPNNLEESINATLIEEQNVKLNQIANDERTGLSPLHTETSVISALTNKLDEINLRVERLQEASSFTARKTGLDSKIKNRLFQLLISLKSAFARSTVELSAAATEHHRINLQHDYPNKCRIYKIPFNLRNEFRRQIADLEKAGIISKSNSLYNTPALFVKQKEKWLLVLDFWKLKEITLTQDFVIPTLDDILHEISGSNYFSALDMKSAFNQIPLHFADRHKTAFSTPDGDKYEFNRLCFGLKNSPKAFQSIAQEVLGDLLHNGALVYIDDVSLFTKTIDEHFELLVTPEGILIDKDKSVSINEFPVPTDQKQIKSFLGCCNFYRRYIKNFAKRALPLTNLLRKDTPFEWTSETQEAFDDIKKAILNPPVLALPDPNAELQITIDASSRGIGAVLEQKYPNSEVKPLYFFSKKLNPSQSKYNATVLEFFAIYTALNFFRPFLLGRKFKVFTDHKPLAGFLSNKNPSSKILRWKLALEEFSYDIHYIRGSLNSVADHLSRCINNITIALHESKDLINPLSGYLPPEQLFRKRFTLIFLFPSKMQPTSILSSF